MAFTPITVTRRYLNLDLTPATGGVTFTPQVPMINGDTVVAAPIGGALDAAGNLNIEIAANNDPDTRPLDVAYLVREEIDHQRRREYYVVIPYDAPGGTIDLSSLPIAEIPPVVTFPVPGPAGPQGEPGPTGDTGPAGADGRTILSGTTAPDPGIGADGDFYLDTTTADLYGPKTAGAWGSATSLIGPEGPTGATGDTGATGADGNTVLSGTTAPDPGIGVDGDFYIDTTADAIYGPKTAGAWGSATSLIGPEGPEGPQGPAGGATIADATDFDGTGAVVGDYLAVTATAPLAFAVADPDALPISTATQTALDAKQNTSEKNAANGYAGLDASSKLTGAQQVYAASTASVGSSASAGAADTAARGDHVHTIGAGVVDGAAVAAAIKDPAAGTAGLRTLGTGATQAAAGNHTHAAGDISSGTLAASRMPSVLSAVRSAVTFAASITLDPAVAGNYVPITATGNITSLDVSLTGAVDRQKLEVAILAGGGATRTVTISTNVRTSTGLTRGAYSIPSNEVGVFLFEYFGLISDWVLVSAFVTAA
jgi:hypothetical protein